MPDSQTTESSATQTQENASQLLQGGSPPTPKAMPPAVETPSLALRGVIVGLVVAYPTSYFFQPGMLRAKLSLGDYIAHVGDVLGDQRLAGVVGLSFLLCPIILGLLGLFLQSLKE